MFLAKLYKLLTVEKKGNSNNAKFTRVMKGAKETEVGSYLLVLHGTQDGCGSYEEELESLRGS